ncbi:hypothetical protein HPB47_004555 [Ixodes persulcatus]|uniref:Uncharacterized protein n=1 Tax=Ixodes persulcatus TaxID=34615 RepID=A0AC60PFD1_IXOPE|nr:hypothetical protein HPB47_004555 [Ixodes persulcatus]
MQKSHLWRLHFPNMEKRLIEDYGCVKPIIRLLKATRDSYMWNLSSYSLKTFVMSQVVANYDSRYWHPDNQGMLFVRVLDFLGHILAQPGPAISFLFHPEVDLTERVTRETRDNISCRIKRIVRKLRLSPDQCYELVLKNQRKGRASSVNVVGDVARAICSSFTKESEALDARSGCGPIRAAAYVAAPSAPGLLSPKKGPAADLSMRLHCGKELKLRKTAASTPWMSVLQSALVVGEKCSQGSWHCQHFEKYQV